MKFFWIGILIAIGSFSFLSSSSAAEKGEFGLRPTTNHGQKWRIGYLEGGPYKNYPLVLTMLIKNLMDMGWMENAEIPVPEDFEDSSQIWMWLSTRAKSNYIQFVGDAYWSTNWDDEKRKKTKVDVIQQLNAQKVDLILAMGTWAGQDLANDLHSVPTIVLSSTDPISANIVKSIEDSGYDHVHARVSPARHEYQLRWFHDFVGFKKLGIAFEDSNAGRSIAAVSDIEKIARERGFEVVSCYSIDNTSREEAEDSVVKCYEYLAPKVDAIYVTIQRGVNAKSLPRLLRPIMKYNLPTFSQGGSDEVEHGVLLSIAQAGFSHVGKFHAETIAKVFNGAKPRDLDQVFDDPALFAFNVEVARRIGLNPPVELLVSANEIYLDIAVAK